MIHVTSDNPIYGFNTQPPEGGWANTPMRGFARCEFQHTAARRRLDWGYGRGGGAGWFQHTAARRRLAREAFVDALTTGFNTQPPEGGWGCTTAENSRLYRFNTQPPEGGWCLSQKPCYIRFRKPNLAKLSRKAEMRV